MGFSVFIQCWSLPAICLYVLLCHSAIEFLQQRQQQQRVLLLLRLIWGCRFSSITGCLHLHPSDLGVPVWRVGVRLLHDRRSTAALLFLSKLLVFYFSPGVFCNTKKKTLGCIFFFSFSEKQCLSNKTKKSRKFNNIKFKFEIFFFHSYIGKYWHSGALVHAVHFYSSPVAAGDELIKLWPQAKAHALCQRKPQRVPCVGGRRFFFFFFFFFLSSMMSYF